MATLLMFVRRSHSVLEWKRSNLLTLCRVLARVVHFPYGEMHKARLLRILLPLAKEIEHIGTNGLLILFTNITNICLIANFIANLYIISVRAIVMRATQVVSFDAFASGTHVAAKIVTILFVRPRSA